MCHLSQTTPPGSEGVAALIAAHKHHLPVGVSGLFKGSSLGSAFKSLGSGVGERKRERVSKWVSECLSHPFCKCFDIYSTTQHLTWHPTLPKVEEEEETGEHLSQICSLGELSWVCSCQHSQFVLLLEKIAQSLRTFVAREANNCRQILIFREHVVIRELLKCPPLGWLFFLTRLQRSWLHGGESNFWGFGNLNRPCDLTLFTKLMPSNQWKIQTGVFSKGRNVDLKTKKIQKSRHEGEGRTFFTEAVPVVCVCACVYVCVSLPDQNQPVGAWCSAGCRLNTPTCF